MYAYQWSLTRENARHYQCQQYNLSNKGAIKSSFIANGLPTVVVEKHFDIKLSNIQQIIQQKEVQAM